MKKSLFSFPPLENCSQDIFGVPISQPHLWEVRSTRDPVERTPKWAHGYVLEIFPMLFELNKIGDIQPLLVSWHRFWQRSLKKEQPWFCWKKDGYHYLWQQPLFTTIPSLLATRNHDSNLHSNKKPFTKINTFPYKGVTAMSALCLKNCL